MPTAYTPAGKLVSLLAHSRFRRVRFHKVQGTNSPLDPRLETYWEERRTQSLYRRALADAQVTAATCCGDKTTGVPSPGCRWRIQALVDIHHITPKRVGGNDDWGNLCLVLRWAHIALHAGHGGDYSKASLKDVPFSGL